MIIVRTECILLRSRVLQFYNKIQIRLNLYSNTFESIFNPLDSKFGLDRIKSQVCELGSDNDGDVFKTVRKITRRTIQGTH